MLLSVIDETTLLATMFNNTKNTIVEDPIMIKRSAVCELDIEDRIVELDSPN